MFVCLIPLLSTAREETNTMITFTNEKNEKRNTLTDWNMVTDPEGVNTYILRFTSKPITARKEEINEFLKNKVKVSIIGDKWANCKCIFGKAVATGIQAAFEIREVKEEVKKAPEVRSIKEPAKEIKKEQPVKEVKKAPEVKPAPTKETLYV